MLSAILHKHIDQMDEIEKKAQDKIDSIISAVDIKELISDPSGVMHQIEDEINSVMVDKYMALAISQGIDLVKVLSKLEDQGKAIKIDASKDPTENQGAAN